MPKYALTTLRRASLEVLPGSQDLVLLLGLPGYQQLGWPYLEYPRDRGPTARLCSSPFWRQPRHTDQTGPVLVIEPGAEQ